MRIFFFILLILHGLIHLMGFTKAFGFSEIKQLTMPISKPVGLAWLLATILLLFTAILFIVKNNHWWILGIVAGLVSQLLIIYYWKDAKFGTLANIIIIALSIIGYGTSSFHSKYTNDIKTNLLGNTTITESTLTENDLAHLPAPVKQYLRYTQSLGKPKVNNFKIVFDGKIRQNEQSDWMLFTSEQYNFMNKPTRLFFMKATMKNLPVAGYHCYNNGVAWMDIRLLSLFKVQYMKGSEMNEAETVTFFNDMCCMAPPTLIDKRITWIKTDGNKVNASFTNNDVTIFAWLHFNEKGELINFTSNDRYAADAGRKLPWATPLKDYKEINGYRLATSAEAIYTYQSGDLCYGTFNLSNIEYNCKN